MLTKLCRPMQLFFAVAIAFCGEGHAFATTASKGPPASAGAAGPSYKVGDRITGKKASSEGGAHQIEWDDLMPADWDPMKGIQTLQLAALGDGDPRAVAALEKLKKAWDEAPVVPSMDKQHVVIAGFVVPLDAEGTTVHEFLLVPWFGACIHTPPPPPNQVIHVTLSKPAKGMQMMGTYWVTGTLHVASASTALGPASYQIDGEALAPYRGGTHP